MDIIKFLSTLPHQEYNGNNDWLRADNNYPIYYLCAKYFKPVNLLEIGSFVGYGLTAFLCGNKKIEKIYSVDSEAYLKKSNTLCRNNLEYAANFLGLDNFANRFFNYNSTSEVPRIEKHYDFIYVDGDHTFQGAMNDMKFSWSLKPKIMIVDDYKWHIEVKEAVHKFATLQNMQFKYWDTFRGWALFSNNYIPENINEFKKLSGIKLC